MNRLAALLGVFVLFFTTATPALAEKAMRIAVTDLVGERALREDFGPFAAELGTIIGRRVVLVPVNSRIDAVRLMRDHKVDFVFTGPAEYVVLRKLTDARPVVGLHRVDYYSVIVARSGEGLARVEDLKGCKMALGSVGSTSSHLGPMQLLAMHDLDPKKDVRIVHTSLAKAWKALTQGRISAVGMGNRKYEAFRRREKNAKPSDYKVLVRGQDLPCDVFVAASHVTDVWISDLRKAFEDHKDRLGAAILAGKGNGKYKGMNISSDVRDEEFDTVRDMYATAGFPAYSAFIGE